MTKILLLPLFVLSLGLVGCADDPKKAADKMTNSVEQGDANAIQAVKEYNAALDTKVTKVMMQGKLTKWSEEELNDLKARFLSSKQKFMTARDQYSHALNLASQNKDRVKVTGKESVERAIGNIDLLLTQIDVEVSAIDTAIAAKKSGDPKKTAPSQTQNLNLPVQDGAREA